MVLVWQSFFENRSSNALAAALDGLSAQMFTLIICLSEKLGHPSCSPLSKSLGSIFAKVESKFNFFPPCQQAAAKAGRRWALENFSNKAKSGHKTLAAVTVGKAYLKSGW
ncbi:hypothetical protein T02_3065 [Trichinella nativa]|uniref:Uncharacterized protein n=2 Tax=Trichinella TaxID=6333 RepID=A0A0V1KQB8_9BILA|nr:hypothetical protein T05_2671 [Trichinella murrelli]KRX56569.1 hypothetical protein T09_5469 [Trichinella sp. T9]KRZ49466.1 hypothetical protein T02_3065 [Trichinella nativa]KRZ83264.1 hypothetical protein T08_12729 [Trichinella sp. T8]